MALTTLARERNVHYDAFGIDPLLDKSATKINEIEHFDTYTISSDEQFNAPLLSYNAYRKVDYWWVILQYNGIVSMHDLTVGLEIRIPNVSDVMAALAQAQEKPAVITTVTI